MHHRFLWLVSITFVFLAIDAFSSTANSQSGESRAGDSQSAPVRTLSAVDESEIPAALQGDFKTGDIAAATAWADRLNLADWLGPLAPLALSPFFGVACLSGLAIWGPDSITDNALLGASGPLRSVPLFAIFAALALMTSLPRLSKVSKPFAQAMDRLEAYAVVVILLAIKLTSSYAGDGVTGDESVAMMIPSSPIVVQAGVFSFTAETLLMIAMTINLLVINSVKFFFEFLVWLTPFPTVDAMFEVGNKAVCAVLMAVYAFSPMLATIVNLLILVFALVVFRWTARRVKFYRTMLLDPVLARVWRSYGLPSQKGMIVFPQESIGPFPAKSCLRLVRHAGDEPTWTLQPASSWSPFSWIPSIGGVGQCEVHLNSRSAPKLVRGWLTHTLEVQLTAPESNDGEISGECESGILKTSRRHDQHFAVLVETMCVDLSDDEEPNATEQVTKVEFA